MLNKKITVFDFDETLLSTNSFPTWCKWLLIKSIKNLKIYLFLKIFYLFWCRKIFNNINHNDFKRHLICLNYPREWDFQFAKHLNNMCWNAVIVEELSKCIKNNEIAIISSAAPINYLLPTIKLRFGDDFSNIIASTGSGTCYFNNHKKNKVVSLIREFDVRHIDSLYTDSIDDIELMKLANEVNFIVVKNSNKKNVIKSLQYFGIEKFNIIEC